jgi:hypothetical protein
MTSINDIQRIYKNYVDTREKNEKRRDYICVATSVGVVGVWCYRQFAPEYLPCVVVVCGHSLLNHTAVYNRGTKLLSKWVFTGRDLRTIGYKFQLETGIYMAAEYAVIKWLSPQFMPPIHKYIIRLRWTGLVVGSISVLTIGSLYIPWVPFTLNYKPTRGGLKHSGTSRAAYAARIESEAGSPASLSVPRHSEAQPEGWAYNRVSTVQNRIVKFLANIFRQVPQLTGIIRAYSGMPANQAAIPEPPPAPKIPYSAVAEFVPADCRTGDSTCGICMQDYNTLINTDKTQLTKTRACGHLFCIPCIESWLNIDAGESVRQAKYCPMCRTPIISLKELCAWNKVVPDDGLEAHIIYIISNFRI